ncbi:hypothetical protein K3495_g3670 [Podosphaera aphanis]|nr:hypothetical protein K3495_g3670 [Podosphaera aphanis]
MPYNHSLPDEGYSEDPLTIRSSTFSPLPPWLLQMSVTERTGYVMNIIAQLPTSQVADIVSRLRPRLYINFFEHLPIEVLLHILGFLDPVSLLNTARASREWMTLALDSRLWKQLYLLEGFRVNNSKVQQFEEMLNADLIDSSEQNDEGHRSKRRGSSQRCFSAAVNEEVKNPGTHKENFRQSRFSGSKTRRESVQMKDISDVQLPPSSKYANVHSPKAIINEPHVCCYSTLSAGSALNMSSLLVYDRRGDSIKKKLNWHYLYSQRRRLESNWEDEKYVNFQLPDPNHPDEAHYECIYTIQYSGKYLVSGSRDKTVRIWNLDTRRLARPPLRAHSGSVLCLQFDADPKEDLIVSGSSDATVVLWKFSTGQIIQRLRKAHKESVLNVQFDKRVLVTCSKDKTIKIFNRKPIHVGEPGYPTDMDGVNPVPIHLNNYGFNPAPSAGLTVRPPYSLIGVLEGHGAAVNAVQIKGDEVVSASGDRLVKVWNWPEQTCVRTLIGHSKGIACVQYDGRRIVSGSSDNEVKVFDKETGLEVASLRAHTDLVRTIQAGFGDLPYSPEKDKADAKAVDYEYFKAIDSGTISIETESERRQLRNAGSSKPEHITAYGAKLPPGGGGGRFGRIVSGSYDETIIIWRRDKEGVWKAQHTLRQEEAAKMAARNHQLRLRSKMEVETFTHHQSHLSHQPMAEQSSAFSQDVNTLMASFPQGINTIQSNPEVHHNSFSHASQQNTAATLMTSETPVNREIIQPASQTHFENPVVGISSTGPGEMVPSNNQSPLASMPNDLMSLGSTLNNPPNANIPGTILTNPPHHHINSNMARVFKLQFDARRIICCSQTNIIVGWDFANNDRKIIEASRFFAPIE